jgi:hypothetical protein
MWVLLVLALGQVVMYPTQFNSEHDCLKAGAQIDRSPADARWACKRYI